MYILSELKNTRACFAKKYQMKLRFLFIEYLPVAKNTHDPSVSSEDMEYEGNKQCEWLRVPSTKYKEHSIPSYFFKRF